MKTYELQRKIRGHVSATKRGIKYANLGGPGDEAPFEEMLGQFASSYLQDKAPSLIPYKQGFQVVERNEDDTKALGITGFKINGMQLFSPIFCIDGEIKGHELLRLADQEIWVPLKEPWLNEIFRRQPITIGSKKEKNSQEYSIPDLTDLVELPSKTASLIPHKFHPAYKDMANHLKKSLPKIAMSLKYALNPMNYVKTASYDGLKRVHHLLSNYPTIKIAFDRLHPNGSAIIGQELRSREIQRNSVALRVLPTKTASVRKYANDVRIISYSVTMSSGPLVAGLSDNEKEKLLRQGYLVQDNRNDSEVTKVVEDNHKFEDIFNPGYNGIYEVISSSDQTKKLVCIKDRLAHNMGQVVLIDPKSHKVQVCAAKDVWCTKQYPTTEYLDWVNGLPTSMPDSLYVMLLRRSDEAYGPLCSHSFNSTESYDGDEESGVWKCPDGYCYDSKAITRTPKGSAFKLTLDTVNIPEDMHICPVDPGKRNELIETIDVTSLFTDQYTKLKVKEAAFRNLEPLKLVVSSTECILNNGKATSIMGGLKSLIQDYGLREKDAKYLMRKAARSMRHTYKAYIKRAEIQSPPIPTIPKSDVSLLTDRVPGGPHGEMVTSTDIADIPANPRVTVDSEYATQDAALAQQAIQNGQTDIFDLSMIKNLYTNGDINSLIDEHITKLTKAMTDAGDLLFRFYWKGDQFKEIYGPKNLPELEGNIKKMFETLGDVVLFLRRNRLNQADYDYLEPLNLSDNKL